MSDFSEILKNAQNRRDEIIAEYKKFVLDENWTALKAWTTRLDDFGKRVLADYGKKNKIFMVVK